MLIHKHAILGLLLATLVYLTDAGRCSWEINVTEHDQFLLMPSPVQANESCWWRLHAVEEGHHVVMKVRNEHNLTGCPRTLAVYDGHNSSDPLLAEICATEKMSIASSGRTLYVDMEQANTFAETRINILVHAVRECGGQLTSFGTYTELTSPGYPLDYYRNLYCSWVINTESESETVILKLTDVDMDQSDMCKNGAVTIYNSNSSDESLLLGRFCKTAYTGSIVQSSQNTLKIEFSANVSSPGTYRGFKLQFYSVAEKSCNFTTELVENTSMFIYSPGYPNSYYNDLHCLWDLWTPNEMDIVLEVVDSELEGSNPSCSEDAVTVWRQYKKVETFCGTSTPNFTIPDGLKVMFTTRPAVGKKGFRMKLTAVTPSCGNQNLTVVQSDRYLVSPGYPMAFERRLHVDCLWTLTSSDPDMMVHIEVLDSQMDGYRDCDSSDKVYVYDGPDTTAAVIQIWCGNMKPVVQSSGSTLTVRFVTTDRRLRRGFKLKYTETREPFSCGGQISVTNSSEQYLVSPGYPGNYRRNMKCVWILRSPQNTRIYINVRKSSIGDGNICTDSYVSVRNGANEYSKEIGVFCGEAGPYYISSGNVMSVILHTGPGSVKQGFLLEYISGSYHDPYDCGGHIHLNSTVTFCRLTSPGYFSNYYFDMKCVWVIETNNQNLQVSTERVDITFSPSCREEYLTLNDGSLSQPSLIGKFCGQLQFQKEFVTSGKEMVVTFQSRRPNNVHSGFSVLVVDGDFEACTLQEQMAWDTITYITSPNYPFNYPRNVHCSWRLDTDGDADMAVQLTVISLNITKVSTACDSNYLEVFDGYDPSSQSLARWCGAGQDHDVLSSSGRYLFLKFDTSYDTPNTGFNVSIKRIFSPQASRNGLIIGIAVGATAGVFVLVAIGYHVVRRGSCFQSDTIAHRTNLRRFFYKNTHQ
ncbi:cubilin-like isoform X2 [Haliotis asinina]|uniref:cubilin-like isoform X2 n=1 Tax=Haliotis asinina TaxID=109174 RepID=UPI0035321809